MKRKKYINEMGLLKVWYQSLRQSNCSMFLGLSDDFFQEKICGPLENTHLDVALVVGTARYTQAIWAMNSMVFFFGQPNIAGG